MGTNNAEETRRGSPQVNIRVPEELLNEVDETYVERGYNSRSEFIRNAIRDALNPPVRLTDDALEKIEERKEELREDEYAGVDDI